MGLPGGPPTVRYDADMKQEQQGSNGKGRVLLALVNEQEQTAVQQVVHQEGMEVHICPPDQDLVETTKKLVPDALVIDADRPRTDLASMARIISRYSETRAVMTILVCPGAPDRARLERLQATNPFAVLPRPLTYARLSDTLQRAIGQSWQLRQELGLVMPGNQSTTRHVEGNNSLLIHQVTCPFHSEPTTLDRYVLRAGKIETEMSFFDIPIYKSATRGADFVDYNLIAITVCPQCLFASNDPAHFGDPAERSIKPVEFNATTIATVQGKTPVRRSIAQGITADFYTERRTPQQALIAYALAIESAKTLYECNKYSMPIELLRLANHHLRLMQLHQKLKSPQDQIENHAKEAAEWLKKAFVLLEGPALFKTAYQLVAISIWTGEDKAAHQYMSRLAELERDPGLQKDVRASLERYHARCKQAWEDREMHRSPTYQPPAEAAAA